MRHLSTEELVDLLDDALPAARREHVAACDACRQQAASVAGVLDQVIESRVEAEPSPLFWGHLAARIKDDVTAEASHAIDGARWQRPLWAGALAAGVLALVATLAPVLRPHDSPVSSAPPHTAASFVDGNRGEAADDIERDEAWALVRTLAEDVEWDETHEAGISARPDAAERLTAELTSREQSELAQLLEHELKRRGT